ncbi:MAG: D-alanyl-D-alanine carboxypeptidase/D-alanyl-D-alanine-endopeptidase [Myxococcales bacterium]|nr:D-alanyl-D-alanine carboxypeptidase/D-alanyl-D-alanine-endopeptidase [Myxococcales bacterium]
MRGEHAMETRRLARPEFLLFAFLFQVGAAAFLTSLAVAADPAGSELSERLDAALADRALRGARVSVHVVEEGSGEVLYTREADRALVPASNQKILTAVAALDAFGPTHRFTTRVIADRAPDASGSVEFLLLQGGGDPALTSEELWRIAADLRMVGLRGVRRGILLDDRAFESAFWHPSWGKVSARAYHAPVGALNVNYGAFAVSVKAGAGQGDPVEVELDPPVPYLRLVNRAFTGAERSRCSLVVDRRAGAGDMEVSVSGSTPAGGEKKVYFRSVLDPTQYAGEVFRMQLAANGISVGGDLRRGVAPESGVVLLEHAGKPLAEVIRLFMKFSNNSIGEGLVKSLSVRSGADVGSWEAGIPAFRAQLVLSGVDVAGLELVDGSGLSYDNRVSPRTLVAALLLASQSFRFGPEFEASLPIAAADGTLEKRAEGAAYAVRAKTGLLTRVTALSGYAKRPGGGRAVFSIIVNGFRGDADRAMAAVDAFVTQLVEENSTALAQPGNKPPSHPGGG